jgi:hypothetical protein
VTEISTAKPDTNSLGRNLCAAIVDRTPRSQQAPSPLRIREVPDTSLIRGDEASFYKDANSEVDQS